MKKPRLTYIKDIKTLFIDSPDGWRECCLDFHPEQCREPKQILIDAIEEQEKYIARLEGRVKRLKSAL